MDPDFWHERWKTNQIGFHQDEINACLVRYWPSLAPSRGGRVLVPLCGKTVSDAEVSRLFACANKVQQLCRTDILSSQPRFRERGLTRLSEQAWRVEWAGEASEELR